MLKLELQLIKMKHIKKYNESSQNLFEEINETEMTNDLLKFKIDNFNQAEIEYLSKYGSIVDDKHIEFTNDDGENFFNFPGIIIQKNNGHYNSSIYLIKTDDEFYYISDNNLSFYKCDTFDGAKQCIQCIKKINDGFRE